MAVTENAGPGAALSGLFKGCADRGEGRARGAAPRGRRFASTVRLAKSTPEMWVPIFKRNLEHVLEAVASGP
jgi:prephenate dehydrogenase